MLSSLKSLKCQSGGQDGSPSPPAPPEPAPAKHHKLARRISRWKMESPWAEEPSEAEAEAEDLQEVRRVVCTVQLVREEAGGNLGITLRGGMLSNQCLSNNVLITHIKPHGPAHRAGCVKAGDRLLAVNGVSLRGSSLAQAQATLKQHTPVMALTIEYDIKVVDISVRRGGPILVEVERDKDEDLGLTLHHTTYGVFIDHIKRASLAERCGALKEGDQILAVNGQRIDTSTTSAQLRIDQVVDLMERPQLLQLQVLPTPLSICTPPHSSPVLASGGLMSGEGYGWYESGAVTHSERLYTTLVRDASDTTGGYGLELCDTPHGTTISMILPGSPAERSGCLCVGDRVLAVNHRSVALDGLTAAATMDLMSSGGGAGGRVVLLTELDVLDSVVPASGVFTVRLMKRGATGLGLTIAATKENELAVCDVKKGSAAHRAGSLLPGDRLLAVNGIPMEQCSAQQLTHMLHQPDQVIALTVQRTDQPTDLMGDRKVTCTVELQRYGGPIGITIAGSEEPTQPITVSGLMAGGLAEQTGALLVGDEILAINEHSVIGAPLSTAHTLLQTSPDLVCLRISRCITPNGRVSNMSPLQPSSVDSAVESWASSHLDLTSSPDNSTTSPGESAHLKLPEWREKEPSHLLDEITNDNLNIQRELEMLSQEINQQSLNEQWENGRKEGEETEEGSNSSTQQQQRQRDAATEANVDLLQRHSVSTVDEFPVSNLSEVRNCRPYLNASQPSLRSEFKSHALLTVELLKDPVYEDFGFSVSDGLYERGVFINRIRKGGPADLTHCVCPFDRILQVNGTCTQDFDCCLTVPLIASSGEKLKLLLARPSHPYPMRGYSEANLLEQAEHNVLTYLTSSRSVNRIVV